MTRPAPSNHNRFFADQGELATLIRQHNWAQTPLGSIEEWPQSLCTAVDLILAAQVPMAIAWGEEGRLLYNDAYRAILGSTKHPEALGQPITRVFPEAGQTLEPLLQRIKTTGTGSAGSRQPALLERNGHLAQRYLDFSCSSIRDEAGAIGGILLLCQETTALGEAEARFYQLFEHAPAMIAILHGPDLHFEYVNTAFQQFVHGRAQNGQPIADVFPTLGLPFIQLLRQVFNTGEPFIGNEVAVHWQREGAAREGFFDFVCQPMKNRQGVIDGVALHGVNITDQVLARRAVEAAEHRLATIVDQMPLGVIIAEAPSGKITQANEQVETILRQPPLTTSTIGLGDIWLGFHEDGRPVLAEEWPLARALQGETVYRAEYRYQRGDGTMIWLRISSNPIRDTTGTIVAGLVVFSDITQQREATAALRASEARLNLALQSSGLGSWMYNFITDQLTTSDQCKTILGLTPDQEFSYHAFVGQIHPDDQAAVSQDIMHAVESNTDFSADYRAILPDQTQRWITVQGRPTYRLDGAPVAIIGTMQDITARKAAEEERERLLAAEQTARAAAEEAVRSRDAFLSIAAHELRTPVTALKGTTQLLARWSARGSMDPVRVARNVGILEHSADRLAELTEDLLDVSRIRTGQLPLDREPLALLPLITADLERRREREDQQHTFALHHDQQLPIISADSGRIDQVLTNLLDNAVKYTPQGGEITIEVRSQDRGIAVSIQDHGIGLPPEAIEQIFVPFGRAKNAIASNLPGMGLGLYICRMIIERHNGWIRAESPGENQGTTMTFWLPSIANTAGAAND